jgi:hypothetical protein
VIFGQLFHGGREIMDTEDGTLAVALAPSAVPTERFHVMPRAMRCADPRDRRRRFGASAARLERASTAARSWRRAAYLPSQFLNPRPTCAPTRAAATPATAALPAEARGGASLNASRASWWGVRISIGEVTPEGPLTETRRSRRWPR